MFDISSILNPPAGLSVYLILLIAGILGILHGITPDEHTWPITFSYSVGSYSTRGGMKSGFVFSAGFTIQRAILTSLGFIGLAAIYQKYDLNGYIYVMVGFVMFIVGYYLVKGTDLHIPLDRLFGGKIHHSTKAERQPIQEVENSVKPVPVRMALVHGFVAGWGFGGFSTIITFILAPQMPNIYYAALVGAFFGLGTMLMQIVIGAIFANIMRVKKLSADQIKYVGRSTAARTLYLGGIVFAIMGVAIIFLPVLDSLAISTGNPIPNLNSIGVETVLVITVVGVIGIWSMLKGYRESIRLPRREITEGK
ncbi:MAG: sulfite exporter TauE/SafE family protein [Thermoplasmatales archaeon]|nr:sulfite exporter TauE/SafE family protein [Candidatus Thermoplasmatota archaeon]MCL6003501.1 sulfite exporter TauE/SafE family protein [Candidatus Thermoplasmatota archaeon]MDA8054430.1 sulfite exporter TauE/SafE family protein [Thermoplasmatales archaeon]